MSLQEEKSVGFAQRVGRSLKPEVEQNNNSHAPEQPLTTDSILDNIERELARRTFEAKQALLKKEALAKEEQQQQQQVLTAAYKPVVSSAMPSSSQIIQTPMIQKIVQQPVSSTMPTIQYVQVPPSPRLSVYGLFRFPLATTALFWPTTS